MPRSSRRRSRWRTSNAASSLSRSPACEDGAAGGEAPPSQADPTSIAALTFLGRLELSLFHRDAAEQAPERRLADRIRATPRCSRRAPSCLLEQGREAARARRRLAARCRSSPDVFDALWIKARIYTGARPGRSCGGRPGPRARDRAGRSSRPRDAVAGAAAYGQVRGRDRGRLAGAASSTAIRSAIEVRAIANAALGRRAEALDDLTQLLGPARRADPGADDALTNYGLLMQRTILLARLGRKDETRQGHRDAGEHGRPARAAAHAGLSAQERLSRRSARRQAHAACSTRR